MKVRRFDDGLIAITGIALIVLVVLPPSRATLDALVATSLAGSLGLVIAVSKAILLDARMANSGSPPGSAAAA